MILHLPLIAIIILILLALPIIAIVFLILYVFMNITLVSINSLYFTWFGEKRDKRKVRKILKAHEDIGFPKIPINEQLYMIAYDNFDYIRNLTCYKRIPIEILDNYITISMNDLEEYIKENYEEVMNAFQIRQEGEIKLTCNNNYYIEFYDRGIRQRTKRFYKRKDFIKFISKLFISAVPKYEKYYPL